MEIKPSIFGWLFPNAPDQDTGTMVGTCMELFNVFDASSYIVNDMEATFPFE